MKHDAGYTLVEMLAALAVVALVFGGLGAGVPILARYHTVAATRIADSEALAGAQGALAAALGAAKREDIVFGEKRRIEIACNAGERCFGWAPEDSKVILVTRTAGDHIAIAAGAGYHFGYQTSAGHADRWAPGGDHALLGIALMGDGQRAAPVAVFQLRQQQAFRCEYDVVIAACREPAP